MWFRLRLLLLLIVVLVLRKIWGMLKTLIKSGLESLRYFLFKSISMIKKLFFKFSKNNSYFFIYFFQVDYDEESRSVNCSCLHFERRGLLCRHAFYTLRANGIKKIPKQYLLRRWKKEAVVLPPLGSSYKGNGSSGSCISKIYSKVNGIINQCGYDEEKLSKFLEQLSVYESGLESSSVAQTSGSKEQSISSMIGIPKPVALAVFLPDFGSNKGGVTGHRYKPSNNDVRFKAAKKGGKI